MRIAKPIIVLAALAASAASQAATQTYTVTLTIGDVSSEGAAPGTNNSSGFQVSPFLCAPGQPAPNNCLSGNFDGSGDKTWTAQGANVLALTPSTTTIYEQRNLNEGNEGTTGNNGTSFFNPYDDLVQGLQDYTAFGQPDCTVALFKAPYSCSQFVGAALKIFPTVVQGIGPAATASGNVVVDDVAGTLMGTVTFTQGTASPAGVAYDFRFADASPFNAARDRVSTSATLALNLTGTFTSSTWTITGGQALLTDPALVCDKGDLSGTLCITSGILGGHQPDGAHLSWKNTPIYDSPDSTGGTVQFTFPGVVGSGTVDVSGNVTGSGEYHRPSGNSGGGCLQGVVYSATPVLLGAAGAQYLGNLTCGTIIAGTFTLAASLAANAMPVANPDSATTIVNVPVDVSVLANDTALTDTPLTVTITAQGTKGVATVNGSPGTAGAISVTYAPNAGALGADSFTYQVADKDNDISSATVSVTINDQPVAVADSAAVIGTNPIQIDVLANDTGLSGAPLTVDVTVAPPGGNAVVNGSPGAAAGISITYTSTVGASTPDTFQYRVTDVNGGFATATVTVTRTPNPIPVAVADSADTDQNTVSAPINVLANDTPGIGTLAEHLVSISKPANVGTCVVNTDNTITYTPPGGFFGTDTCTYRLIDSIGQSSTAEVTIAVAKVVTSGSSLDVGSLLAMGVLGVPVALRRHRKYPRG